MRIIGNSDFSTKPTNFYNLDVINSVGYRVKSCQGTMFRIWATGPGKISHELAIEKAESEYMRYKEIEIEHIHLESIKELDKDIRLLNNK